ncbi:uncharacterized protein [Henckelia pumila]|uniref:uncharacterized protein isoform X3 n=2 Tax=Henckelia pumila TaxID=405737 RepID=UPI003C6E7023
MHMMSSSSPNSRSEPPKSFRPCAELACPIIKLLVIKVRWLYRYLCKNRAKDSDVVVFTCPSNAFLWFSAEKVWWLYRYLFKNKAKESGTNLALIASNGTSTSILVFFESLVYLYYIVLIRRLGFMTFVRTCLVLILTKLYKKNIEVNRICLQAKPKT